LLDSECDFVTLLGPTGTGKTLLALAAGLVMTMEIFLILGDHAKVRRAEIVASDSQAKIIGLTDFEYAFYTAVASNDSAKKLMQHDQLRELAIVLTQRVRENASIDWTIKDNVKTKLKVIVKRLLRQYGYPPDMQLLATETVLKQAEMIANELAVN